MHLAAACEDLLQLCGDQRPAGVEIIRRTIFELAAHKARQHALAESQQLAGQQGFVEGVAFAFAHFSRASPGVAALRCAQKAG